MAKVPLIRAPCVKDPLAAGQYAGARKRKKERRKKSTALGADRTADTKEIPRKYQEDQDAWPISYQGTESYCAGESDHQEKRGALGAFQAHPPRRTWAPDARPIGWLSTVRPDFRRWAPLAPWRWPGKPLSHCVALGRLHRPTTAYKVFLIVRPPAAPGTPSPRGAGILFLGMHHREASPPWGLKTELSCTPARTGTQFRAGRRLRNRSRTRNG